MSFQGFRFSHLSEPTEHLHNLSQEEALQYQITIEAIHLYLQNLNNLPNP